MVLKVRIVVWGDVVAWSRREGDFPAGGASLFLNLGAGDLRVFICENSSSCTFKSFVYFSALLVAFLKS